MARGSVGAERQILAGLAAISQPLYRVQPSLLQADVQCWEEKGSGSDFFSIILVDGRIPDGDTNSFLTPTRKEVSFEAVYMASYASTTPGD
jgi:hypothetical protein